MGRSAQRFGEKALGRRRIAFGPEKEVDRRPGGVSPQRGYPPAIVSEAALERNCRHRPVQYLNNVLEQDHRAIKRRINASEHFRSFWGAWRTIAGYEAIHMIRKRQACEGAPGGRVVLMHCFILGLFQRGGGLILSTLSPNFALLQSVQHYCFISLFEFRPRTSGPDFEFSLEWCGLVIHPAHAAHAAHAARTTRSRFFLLGQLGHQCFGGEQESRD